MKNKYLLLIIVPFWVLCVILGFYAILTMVGTKYQVCCAIFFLIFQLATFVLSFYSYKQNVVQKAAPKETQATSSKHVAVIQSMQTAKDILLAFDTLEVYVNLHPKFWKDAKTVRWFERVKKIRENLRSVIISRLD